MTSQSDLFQTATPKSALDDVDPAAYRERLRELLKDPDFRSTEGFPIGSDEAILAMSDPPFYTACPNPFLAEFIDRYGHPYDPEESYHREPFAADVTEGKNNDIYSGHAYHTKVPHRAIMSYLLHYTNPGDVVLDGFSGTGMTGVAAQQCESREEVASLSQFSGRFDSAQHVSLGARTAVLVDLSPAAAFISHIYNHKCDPSLLRSSVELILDLIEKELGWVYAADHVGSSAIGRIQSVVWSTVFICPTCTAEIQLPLQRDESEEEVIRCRSCGGAFSRRDLNYAIESYADPDAFTERRRIRRVPVEVHYQIGRKRFTRHPVQSDFDLLDRVNTQPLGNRAPRERMLFKGANWGDTFRKGYHLGYEVVSDFYFRRTLLILDRYRELADELPAALRSHALSVLTSVAFSSTHLYKYRTKGGGQPAGNNLYVPALIREQNVLEAMRRKLDDLVAAEIAKQSAPQGPYCVSTSSSTALKTLPENCIDYVFVDPPFGSNIMYSESNFIWEDWLRVYTSTSAEAIVNNTQGKTLTHYEDLIAAAFAEFHRVLKPRRWMTVEFHNSANSVWNAIQNAILRAGFVVADVRTLDKKQSTFKQVTSALAVKQDLVISAYKPSESLENALRANLSDSNSAWHFTREYLSILPVSVTTGGQVQVVAERQKHLLFGRMVAVHIQRGTRVPISASEFYFGLDQRFILRDSMYFLTEQAAEYDAARLRADRPVQLQFYVHDEKSTIEWLRLQFDSTFGGEPQTYQEIQPKFLRELNQARHEALPELRDMLDQNFLEDAQGRWYSPDPARAGDLEKLRLKSLLREFETYLGGRGKLKQFRTEAVRAGFAAAYGRNDFKTIVDLAERLPESVLQEDPDLWMYFDAARLRV